VAKSMKYLLFLSILLISGHNHLFAYWNHDGIHSSIKDAKYASSGMAEDKLESIDKSATVIAREQNKTLNESLLDIEEVEESDDDKLASCNLVLEGSIYSGISLSIPLRIRAYQYFSSITSCRYILLQVFRI
jgi:hypothetical protein